MNRTKAALFLIVIACAGLLGFAMYLQLALDMLPCPLCVMQRYAFLLIGLSALFALIFSKQHRPIMAFGIVASLIGVGISGYQVWVLTQPPGSCGVDPLTAPLNGIFIAQWFPSMFKASGFCDTPYDPILGLSIPAWACVWFVVFTLAQIVLLISKKKERVFFGKIRP
ncbi:disulfide bond formation protein B [Undibacterium sp. LX40W]|uniref:Disulfide bond formation protein B n=1 Tax=Undibacterium nitidum TaxID=2762298 RepID=A0A923HNA6_9BURK|nr:MULTISPECIES: disulfide bond formation protein B [Undibacterium]MBC3882529.1 disulfide bond formation protein B [Undibacterium nitidum]MBC3892810.1 disulfide bond formation protein B [Undibacterium sp. LX40W]